MNGLSLSLHRNGSVENIELELRDLIIAGWTGRDRDAVQAHIHELEMLGVKPPSRTPVFYRVGASLITTDDSVQVLGTDSTGEVEFVLLRRGSSLLVGLGSDHTDRKAEAIGVALSKQLCPKVLASDVWAFEDVEAHWDQLVLRSYIIEAGRRVLYQEGSVSRMLHPRDLTAGCGVVFGSEAAMFGGTFPVIGDLRWSEQFDMEIEDPVLKRRISHHYAVEALPVEI